jgi:phage repressor protein C with HTH and peptisase S24 domain
MILILSLLNTVDVNGECNLESVTKSYIDFYKERLTLNLAVDRDGCPYSNINKLNDANYMQRSLLANPFEKFERKRFMYHCKDLNHIAFSTTFWDKINNKDDLLKIKKIFFHDLVDYYESLGKIPNQEELIQRWNIPENWNKENLPRKIVEWNIHNSPPENELYNTFIPLYDLQAAAGAFSESQPVEPLGWVQPNTHRKINNGLFVAQVIGHSMEPRIPDGSYCLFKAPVTGTRNGRIVLAQHNSIEDPDHGGRYTVKEYASTKQIFSEDDKSNWRHSSITLKALNPDYKDIQVDSNEEEIKIIAEFLELVEPV